MAEPSGEYSVRCSVDLSHLFGKIEETRSLTITRPPADILEKRLAELASDDVAARRRAASDLAYFPKEGNRVFPALVACFRSADEQLRTTLVYSMGNYADQFAPRTDFFLGVLGDKAQPERVRHRIAYNLGMYGAVTPAVERALEAAAEADEEAYLLTYALKAYRGRKETAGTGN